MVYEFTGVPEGAPTRRIRVRAVAAGFQHHLSKPVEPVELIVVAASLVESR